MMEEGNVCTFCKRSFLNGNLLGVHMTEHLGIEKHNNIEHDQVGIDHGYGVELDRKVIKKEVKLEVDEEKVIKKEIKLEVDKNYGVQSFGPNENPKKSQAEVDKKVIKKEIKLEVDEEKVIKREIKVEVDEEKVIKKEIKMEVHENYGVKSYGPNKSRASVSSSHPPKRKLRSNVTNSDEQVKKGALSLVMLSVNRTDLYLDDDKLVVPNVYVDGVKKEGNGESGPGQSSNNNLRSNVQEVRDKGNRKADDNQCSTVLREPKTYKCQTCFKEFSSFQGLGGHMKIHKQTP